VSKTPTHGAKVAGFRPETGTETCVFTQRITNACHAKPCGEAVDPIREPGHDGKPQPARKDARRTSLLQPLAANHQASFHVTSFLAVSGGLRMSAQSLPIMSRCSISPPAAAELSDCIQPLLLHHSVIRPILLVKVALLVVHYSNVEAASDKAPQLDARRSFA